MGVVERLEDGKDYQGSIKRNAKLIKFFFTENNAFDRRREQLNAEIEERMQEMQEIGRARNANIQRLEAMRVAAAALGPVLQQLERACQSPERN